MDIRFRTGKAPTVKFSPGDRKNVTAVMELLSTYGDRMGDDTINELAACLEEAAIRIGIIAIEDPKEA